MSLENKSFTRSRLDLFCNGGGLFRWQVGHIFVAYFFFFSLPISVLFYRIVVGWLSYSVSAWRLGQHVCCFSAAIAHLSIFWCFGKSSCYLEDTHVPFDCKPQISTKHWKQKTSHGIAFKKTSIQSYFRSASSLLTVRIYKYYLAFMTRHHFFPACPPFVIWHRHLDCQTVLYLIICGKRSFFYALLSWAAR